jgi:hypothetical protein
LSCLPESTCGTQVSIGASSSRLRGDVRTAAGAKPGVAETRGHRRDRAGAVADDGRRGYRDDFAVLQLAAAFEQATKAGLRRPAIVAA